MFLYEILMIVEYVSLIDNFQLHSHNELDYDYYNINSTICQQLYGQLYQ